MKPLFQTGLGDRSPGSRLQTGMAWLGVALAALILAGLAYAGFCAFTWRKFAMFDYGVYTNMIWNSGHGHLFRCLLDRSYLATHLSFTLALLGPLFHAWNHPFLLWTAQWFLLAGGVAVLARAAVRLRVPAPVAAAIAVFFVGCHFTQQTLLSEFHGVSLYLLLVPWLYHCLNFHRRWVWVPWLLALGVREEAALVVLPLLLYFAVRERWLAGYVYAALSVGYVVLATTALYPLLTGISLIDRRAGDLAGGGPLEHLLDVATLRVRLKALFWVALPALPFVRKKGWIPLVLFPSLVLVQAMAGGKEYQYSLALHYAAPVVACLAVALVEAAARRTAVRGAPAASGPQNPLWTAVALLLVTAASYWARGFLPGAAQRISCYVRPHGAGLRTLRAARRLPSEGVLICPAQLAGFCANRKDILDWRHYDPARHQVDLVFSELKYLDHPWMGFRGWLEDGTFGVVFFDGANLILQRGADPAPNRLVFDAMRHVLSGTQFPRTGASNAELPITARHWAGSSRGNVEPLVAAWPNELEAGDYEAVFLFSARTPDDGGMDSWGTLQVRLAGRESPLAEAEIEPVGCGPQALRSQRLAFSLAAASKVEAVVVGRRAELWLLRADFVRRGEPWDL